jgi:hypothetical protein
MKNNNSLYSVTYADGRRYGHRLAGRTVTLSDALADIRQAYPSAVDNSDDEDSRGRILVWASEGEAENDDGKNAVASLWREKIEVDATDAQ